MALAHYVCDTCGIEFDSRSFKPRKYCSKRCYGEANRITDPIVNFWSKVRKTNDCWEWTGAVGSHGYGGFAVWGKDWTTHRYAFTITRGPIPDGLHVLHKCDNRICVNPDHLFLGTNDDNIRDMHAKGRYSTKGRAHGANHTHAKLTEQAVREISATAAAGERHGAIAARFGISRAVVQKIVAHTAWMHVS